MLGASVHDRGRTQLHLDKQNKTDQVMRNELLSLSFRLIVSKCFHINVSITFIAWLRGIRGVGGQEGRTGAILHKI
jgi:hypothetical protein